MQKIFISRLVRNDLVNQMEQIQNDLICLLDDCPDKIVDKACQIVVDGFKPLIEKMTDN